MVLRTPRDIGAFARGRRKELGLDQATVADKIGVSRKWIIDFEKGKSRLELGLVLRALSVLGIELAAEETQRPPTGAEDLGAILTRARQPVRPAKRAARPRPAKKR